MQLGARYVSDDDNLIFEYSVQADRDGSFDPADIVIEEVTILGVVEPLKNLSQALRKAIRDFGAEVDFDDDYHEDRWEDAV